MSSKRARRNKRKQSFKEYDPEKALPNPPKKTESHHKKEPEEIKLPGQWFLRVGSAFMLIGGVLSAATVWYSLNTIQGMTPDDLIALTAAYGQTPILYMTVLMLTSIMAVLQFSFGYYIFKNARNPFLAKRFMIYGGIMFALNLGINLYVAISSTSGFQIFTLFYGCFIPLSIMYGAYKNMKFAQAHPEYDPPEPTQMF